MAALSIAFEAPETSATRCPSQTRPIDLVYLATQTLGDKGLEMESLQAFARQARSCLNLIGAGVDTNGAARRLQIAADAVGAFRVSDAAATIEADGSDPASIAVAAAAVLEAENFILKLCR